VQNGLDLINLLSTGGDAATMALLWLVWRQSQTIFKLDKRIIKLETLLAFKFGVSLEESNK